MELLGLIVGMSLADITLSGDNALIIGAAAATLPPKQRRIAILCGGGIAMLLRIALASVASMLLQLPWLQAVGGVLVLGIAIRLLASRNEGETEQKKAKNGLFAAMVTILLADVTMSLDNVLAIGAMAHGNILALVLGICLSVVILLAGSALIARLMQRLPWLLDIAALVLAWTGADMLLHDHSVGPWLAQQAGATLEVTAAFLIIVLVADFVLRYRAQQRIKLKRVLIFAERKLGPIHDLEGTSSDDKTKYSNIRQCTRRVL